MHTTDTRPLQFLSIADFLVHSTRQHPDRVAAIADGAAITYAQLLQRATSFARGLNALGIWRGDRVALTMPNSMEMVVALFGITLAGGATVSINHRLRFSEISALIERSHAGAVVSTPTLLDGLVLPDRCPILIAAGQPPRKAIHAHLFESVESKPPTGRDERVVDLGANDEAVLQYTSGSTGRPKGIVRTNRGEVFQVLSILMGEGAELSENTPHIVLTTCPLDHLSGRASLLSSIARGGCFITFSHFATADILDAIQEHGVRALSLLPPATYSRIMNHPSFSATDVSTVRTIQCSAGSAPSSLMERLVDAFPAAELASSWGQSESGTGTTHRLTAGEVTSGVERLGSVGKPMPFLEAMVVDPSGHRVASRTSGELVTRGPAQLARYDDDDAGNLAIENGWVRSGDQFWEDEDGFLYLTGRLSQIIKTGGVNVSAARVEEVLRRHPDVRDCYVLAIPDTTLGEAIAAVVEGEHQLTPENVVSHCREHLAGFEIPRHIRIVGDMGRNSVGKVEHRALRELFSEL